MAVVVKRAKKPEANVETSINSMSDNGGYRSRKHLPGDGNAGMLYLGTSSLQFVNEVFI